VFTARYGLSPYIKQIRFVFEGLNLKVISASFTQQNDATSWRGGVVYFSHNAETAVRQSPLLGLCYGDQKIVLQGWKPILAIL
jgi:hypothetical protein